MSSVILSVIFQAISFITAGTISAYDLWQAFSWQLVGILTKLEGQ